MASRNPESTAQVAGHPIHPMLIPFPVAFLVATLVSDLIFLRTGNPGWATASLWLLGAALVMAALAAVAGLIDFLGDDRIRDLSAAWHHMIGNVIAVVLALINWYRRYAATEPGIPSGGVVLSFLRRADPALHRLARLGDGLQAPGGSFRSGNMTRASPDEPNGAASRIDRTRRGRGGAGDRRLRDHWRLPDC